MGALLVALASSLGSVSVARAISLPANTPSESDFTIEGQATLRDASIDLECHNSEASSCHVRIRFELEAGASGARIYVPVTSGQFVQPPEIRLNGRELGADELPEIPADRFSSGELARPHALIVVDAHQRTAFEMSYSVGPLSRNVRRWPDRLPPPVDARHMLLGEGQYFSRVAHRRTVVDIDAPSVSVEGPVRINASSAPDAHILVGPDRVTAWPQELESLPRISVEGDDPVPALVHGGPVLTLGGLIRTDGQPERFILGVGYELGFAEYFLVSAWVETDFESSIQEALLVEVASPGRFLIPSIAAGVGVVSTQLGNRDVDFGLRLRATIHAYVLGFVADFDYFFASGSWNIALAARASI